MHAHRFFATARHAQRPPSGDWRTWIFLGGRGAGKTRAGAEWVRWSVLHGEARRIALIGPTLHDVREVMICGPSGLMSLDYPRGMRPRHEPSRRRVVWPNGAEAFGFSADDPESLRGPQFDLAWCDEIGVWAKGIAVWDMLQMGLRLGVHPRAMATTTPRPVPLVKRLVSAPDTAVTRARTEDNAENLSPGFLAVMERAYGGTALARQELGGELIEDFQDALWQRSDLERVRTQSTSEQFDRIVVAVDPPAGARATSDACGIIAAGQRDAMFHVLADASVQGLRPEGWAGRVAATVEAVGASEVTAEANQGGEMVREVLLAAGCDVPVRLVHARISKAGRAQPIAALYAQDRVRHAGHFPALEDEMCRFGADGAPSPDRVDALVWALWTLSRSEGQPRVRGV